MSNFIPANPGFYAVDRLDGVAYHLPIIGWWIREKDDGELNIWPVGVDGRIDADADIYGPDGKKASLLV